MGTSVRQHKELAELHFHLGQSVEPHVLWSIAHEQGIRLPSKDYWEFSDLVTLNKPEVTWEDYHRLFHWSELIQSSPAAMERAVYEVVSGAYRVGNITLMEPGFNPLFRNRGGERDLDHIILAALRGMEKALVEYPTVRAGLHFMLDRRLPYEKNEVIVRKAIKYRHRGVVGIDIAGPRADGFRYEDYSRLYAEARAAGLGTTVHTGEDGTAEEMDHVLDVLPLNRVNHGFRCYASPPLMAKVRSKGITLCLCPSSNLRVKFVNDLAHLGEIVAALWRHEVRFCINTDNPAMLRTNLAREMGLVRDSGALNDEQLDQTVRWAVEASFVDRTTDSNLYL